MVVPRIARAVAQRLSRARRLVELDFSPRLPPWSRLRHPTSEVQRLRRDATRVGPLASRRPGARAVFAAAAIVWHLRAPWDAVSAAALHGRRIREAGGPGRWTLFRDSLAAAFAWNVSPRVFHALRLWDSATGLSAETVVQDAEIGIHLLEANRAHSEVDSGLVANKRRFEEACKRARLPVAETAVVLSGPRSGPGPVLPPSPLFFKPLDGQQGVGAQRWEFDSVGHRWTRRGVRLDEAELLEVIDGLRRGRSYLVQRCLENHRELAEFCGRTLSTFRVVTALEGEGPARVVCVGLKVGRVGAEVDNRHAGGLVCGVDMESGRLLAGVSGSSAQMHRTHPDHGGPLEGRRLTVHRDVVALAVRAHRALPHLPVSLGWDVAATPAGPVLIEANSLWGSDLAQVALRGPLPDWLVARYRN